MLPSMQFNLRFEVCDTKCEIKNVDPDKYSFIVFIKKMKKCISYENLKV